MSVSAIRHCTNHKFPTSTDGETCELNADALTRNTTFASVGRTAA